MDLTSRDVLGFRIRAQQLDRDAPSVADTAVLDLGVQDTGTDGAAWALRLRGAPEPAADELVLLWTIRGAPTSTAGPTSRTSPRPPPLFPRPTPPSGSSTPPAR